MKLVKKYSKLHLFQGQENGLQNKMEKNFDHHRQNLERPKVEENPNRNIYEKHVEARDQELQVKDFKSSDILGGTQFF